MVLRRDRGGEYVHVLVCLSGDLRKLDRLGIQPIRETTCQGAVPGRCSGIPISRFHWRFKRGGRRQSMA